MEMHPHVCVQMLDHYIVSKEIIFKTRIQNVTTSTTPNNWQYLSEVPTYHVHALTSHRLAVSSQISKSVIWDLKCKLIYYGCLNHYKCLTFLDYPTHYSAFLMLHMRISIGQP